MKRFIVFGTTVLILLLVQTAYSAERHSAGRPANWATPIHLEGVPNLYKVSGTLYRSAQPTARGMKNLRNLGIKTILNLREFHSDKELIGDAPLAYRSIPMSAWSPEEADAVAFLRIVTDPKNAPVLVHCQHGADRTGLMCALYRVAVQGWTKAAAIKEMEIGGYGFHATWFNIISWFKHLDIAKIKTEAGLSPSSQYAPADSVSP